MWILQVIGSTYYQASEIKIAEDPKHCGLLSPLLSGLWDPYLAYRGAGVKFPDPDSNEGDPGTFLLVWQPPPTNNQQSDFSLLRPPAV